MYIQMSAGHRKYTTLLQDSTTYDVCQGTVDHNGGDGTVLRIRVLRVIALEPCLSPPPFLPTLTATQSWAPYGRFCLPPAYFLLQPTAHGPRRLAFAVDRHQLRFLPMTLRLAAPTRRAFPRFPPPLLCLPPPIPQTKSMPPLRPLCLLACPPPPYLPPQSARPLPLLAAPRSPPRRPPLLLVHWRRWKLSGVHAHTLPP